MSVKQSLETGQNNSANVCDLGRWVDCMDLVTDKFIDQDNKTEMYHHSNPLSSLSCKFPKVIKSNFYLKKENVAIVLPANILRISVINIIILISFCTFEGECERCRQDHRWS